MTVQEAARIVRMLHTSVPSDRKATEEERADRIEYYAAYFADYPGELVYRVAFNWTKTSPFMPAPEELKKACDQWKKLSGHLQSAGVIASFMDPISPEDAARMDALWDEMRRAEEEGENAKQVRDLIR